MHNETGHRDREKVQGDGEEKDIGREEEGPEVHL
jgi:hypothetical protein